VVRLGVSRVTVRQAIADLVAAGLLERVHGKGTYLTGPQVDSRLHLTSFSREMRDRGLVPATLVLSAAEQPADNGVSEALRIRPGQPVVRVERLRTADGTPMAYEVGHYPSVLFPGLLQRELGSLYDVFASEYGVVVSSGEQTVRAESADAHQARVLGIAKRAPLLVQERVTYAGERAIEMSTFLVSGRPISHPHGDHAPRCPGELARWPDEHESDLRVDHSLRSGAARREGGRRRRLVRSRVISLVITIALLLLIYLWRREDMQGAVFVVIYLLVLGTSLAWLACQHRSLCAGQTGGKDTR
jgi:GntR family transcriptional regulator